MVIGGTVFNELLRDNYRRVKGKWVKMTKDEAEAYDKDPNINMAYADPVSESSDSESEYVDIDEFEYDEDGHAIFPF